MILGTKLGEFGADHHEGQQVLETKVLIDFGLEAGGSDVVGEGWFGLLVLFGVGQPTCFSGDTLDLEAYT